MYFSKINFELATSKEWDIDLSDSERAEIEAMAEEAGVEFYEAFEVWSEQANKSNADAWEWQL